MAGDWIPIRLDLDEDPAVVGMASSLNVPETRIIGWLWKLWSVASKQTDNGWLPHYTPQKIDAIVSCQGFSDALVAVGWLLPRSGGLELPNFENWLSQSAKRRLKEAQRKRNVRNLSALDADKKRTPLLSSPVISSKGNEGPGERGPPPGEITAEFLADEWCYLLSRKRLGGPRDLPLDMAAEFAELIRLGEKPAKLLASIRAASRDRGEHFWQFKERIRPSNGKATERGMPPPSEELGRKVAEDACQWSKAKESSPPTPEQRERMAQLAKGKRVS